MNACNRIQQDEYAMSFNGDACLLGEVIKLLPNLAPSQKALHTAPGALHAARCGRLLMAHVPGLGLCKLQLVQVVLAFGGSHSSPINLPLPTVRDAVC